MKLNMGPTDRKIRTFLVAPVLVVLGIVIGGVVGIVLFVLAAVMLATSAVGFCPLYPLVGANTCKHKTAA